MPKTSERRGLLRDLEDIMKYSMMTQHVNQELFTSDEDSMEASESEDESMYFQAGILHEGISNQRFLHARSWQPRSKDYITNYFLDQSASDFRTITRVNHETFAHILSLIENHPIFHNQSLNPQHPVHWQLACTLDRLGNDGQGVSHARSKLIWGIGASTVHLYTRRVVKALCDLKGQFIRWPNREERHQISRRLARKGFRNAVGFVDGTCIPVHKKPSFYGNVFMDRKKRYSVNAQVVCDDKYRITFFATGHPGSVGDSRVYNSCSLARNSQHAFSENEYLLADSAYATSRTVVPSYKENQRDIRTDVHEPRMIELFNTYLAKVRIINEHTIGVLKSHWSCLRGMRIDLHKDDDMRSFVEQLTACVVLHNICHMKDPWEDEVLDEEDPPVAENYGEGERHRMRLSAGQLKRLEVRTACLAHHGDIRIP